LITFVVDRRLLGILSIVESNSSEDEHNSPRGFTTLVSFTCRFGFDCIVFGLGGRTGDWDIKMLESWNYV